LNALCKLDRARASRPAGAVRDRDERRLDRTQPRDRFKEQANAFVVPGREELEGEKRLALLQRLGDFNRLSS